MNANIRSGIFRNDNMPYYFFSKELNTSKVLQKRQKTKAFVKHKEDKIRYNIFFSNVQVA